MTDAEDKFWNYSIAFVVLVFTIYPMTKDYIDNQVKTLTAAYYAIFFAFIVLLLSSISFYFLKKWKKL